MKILFFSHYFYPEGGACAARVFAHCKRWVAVGHKVTVVTCMPNYPTGILHPGYRNHFRSVEMVEGIRVIRVYTYLGGNRSGAGRGYELSHIHAFGLCSKHVRPTAGLVDCHVWTYFLRGGRCVSQ